MTFKVIQWGTGGVGTAAARRLLTHPDFELVGALVYDPEKAGKDVGVIVQLPDCGVRATTDKEAIFAMDADVVIHTSRLHMTNDEQDEDLLRLLASGKNVISCTQGYHIPTYGAAYAQRYIDACKRGNSSFYGVGENPGFMFERLMPTLTGLVRDIDLITFEEFIDLSGSPNAPMLMEVMGFGRRPDEMSEDRPTYKLYERLFHEVLNGAAQNLGITLDRIEYTLDYGTVDYDLASPTVKAGHVVAQRCTQIGYLHGKPFLKVIAIWLVSKDLNIWGIDKLERWTTRDYWRLKIDGNPSLALDLNLLPSTHPEISSPVHTITAMTCVNAIPDVVAAPPGLVEPRIFAPWRERYRRL